MLRSSHKSYTVGDIFMYIRQPKNRLNFLLNMYTHMYIAYIYKHMLGPESFQTVCDLFINIRKTAYKYFV